jgi:hypothetical protein
MLDENIILSFLPDLEEEEEEGKGSGGKEKAENTAYQCFLFPASPTKNDSFHEDGWMDNELQQLSLKELIVIRDYYRLPKKGHPSKKSHLIFTLTLFESLPENRDIVNKRKTLWYFLRELKSDKFMKRNFIL